MQIMHTSCGSAITTTLKERHDKRRVPVLAMKDLTRPLYIEVVFHCILKVVFHCPEF
eukprot:m.213376 g.213376  ORF g.213376 m.213376 type:complete len:57 (+) comp15083_c2_seq6:3440-3610(+)